MAGTLRHINVIVTGANANQQAQNTFYWLRKAFDAHSNYSRIASYYGQGGTGLGPNDGSDGGASGDCRWAVYRKTGGTKFDVLISANNGGGGGLSSTDPSGSLTFANLDTGIGFSVAYHTSEEAWNGTTNNNGQDSFSSSRPWKSGSVVLPRTNGIWGYASASQNDLATFASIPYMPNSGGLRWVADDDNFAFFGDGFNATDDAIVNFFGAMIQITPASGSFDLTYFQTAYGWDSGFSNQCAPVRNVLQSTDNDPRNGGVWIMKPTASHFSSSFGMGLEWDISLTDATLPTFGPHPLAGTGSFTQEAPMLFFGAYPANFFLGHSDFLRVVNPSLNSFDLIGSGSRVVLGFGSNLSAERLVTSCSLPWSASWGMPSSVSGTFYTSGTAFVTSGEHTLTYITQSFLFDRVTVVTSSTTWYRTWNGSSYDYSTTYTTGSVVVGTFFTT